MNNQYYYRQMSEYIKHIIVDYLQGTASNKDIRRLKKWLNENDENREYFSKIKSSWTLSGKFSEKVRFDDEVIWQKLQKRLSSKESGNKTRDFNLSGITRVLRIAATWLIIFTMGASLTYLFTRKDYASISQKTAIISPLGSKSQVMLPDGSSVWLNAGSMLEYSADFNLDQRELKLSGEAFFEVTTNPEKPFIVYAGNIAIKALGTSFNVKAYPEEKKVVTTLVKGEVMIEGVDEQMKPFAIALQPKQNVTYYEDSKIITNHRIDIAEESSEGIKARIPSVPQILSSVPAVKDQNVKTELFTSWKDKRWIIEGEIMSNLFVMLERRFNVTISIRSEELKSYRFSGTIENETLEQVFQILRLTLPVDYTIDKGKVIVNMDKNLKERYKSAYN